MARNKVNRIGDPQPRVPPGDGCVAINGPQPRDGDTRTISLSLGHDDDPQHPRDPPNSHRQYAMAPQPRDDGKHRQYGGNSNSGPQPRDPGKDKGGKGNKRMRSSKLIQPRDSGF